MAIVREYSPKLKENGLIVMNESGIFRPEAAQIKSTYNAVKVLESIGLREEAQENLIVLCMNSAGKVTGFFRNSTGSVNSCYACTRDTLKKALLLNAVSVIIAHNHPAGTCKPSREDHDMTEAFKRAFDAIGVKLLDHIIIPAYSNNYYSFAEENEI